MECFLASVGGPPPSARAPRRCLGGWYAYGWRVADVGSALRDGCPANVSGVWLTKASIAHRWREGALRTVCRMRMPRLSALVGVGVLEGCALQCHGIWFNSHLIPFSEVGGTAHTVRLVGSSSACHCARRWETSAGLWWHMLHCHARAFKFGWRDEHSCGAVGCAWALARARQAFSARVGAMLLRTARAAVARTQMRGVGSWLQLAEAAATQ